MTHLVAGTPAPVFIAPTPRNPRFNFSSVAGRYILLAFLPVEAAARAKALAQVDALRNVLAIPRIMAFLIARDAATAGLATETDALRWFFDPDLDVSRLYGAVDAEGEAVPLWVLLDPSLRILAFAGPDGVDRLLAGLSTLPDPDLHAGVPIHAPVLIVPRIFEGGLCRRLIAYYDEIGGSPSGVMREVDGRTVGVLDGFKRRRDVSIEDDDLRQELRARIRRRLLPEIEKAFQAEMTYIERYIVARYDALDGGWFHPHRDNTTAGTAHRKFAVSINLNADAFEGGDVRFPEFGGRTYRPPTGGAVVFSCSLLHEVTQVTRGVRYATLPFLYDQAGETIRRANLHLLQPNRDPEPVGNSAIANEGAS